VEGSLFIDLLQRLRKTAALHENASIETGNAVTIVQRMSANGLTGAGQFFLARTRC
jgi:hypothetical protein